MNHSHFTELLVNWQVRAFLFLFMFMKRSLVLVIPGYTHPPAHLPTCPPNNFLLAPVITWLHFHPIMALSLPPQLYCSLIGWFWHSPPIAEVRWHMPSKFVEIQCLVNFGIKFVLKIFWIKLFSQSCGGICLQRLCQFSVCFILW